MGDTIFCLYCKLATFWHKHATVLLSLWVLALLALFLLTWLGGMGTHPLLVSDAGSSPHTDPGGGGPW